MFVVWFVAAVGSSAARLARITPPSRYFATIWAGVGTPASFTFALAAAAVTDVALSPYNSGTSTWPTRSTSLSDAAAAAARAAALADEAAHAPADPAAPTPGRIDPALADAL